MSTTTAAPPALEFKEAQLRFRKRDGGELHVLNGVDLQVQRGEFICVVGPSGCGKSTLLRLADGLLKPTSGEALLDGAPVGKPSLRTAMVFQDDLLLPWRTILSNVLLPLEFNGRKTDESIEAARNILSIVGLREFESAYPAELSGGMRQRANLARGLIADPDILLLDEPFSALDAQTRELMQVELLRIWRHFKKTVIFITHQIDEAIFLADRVVVMSGRPSKVIEVLDVDMERPRSLNIKRDPEFLTKVDHVWDLVMDQQNSNGGRL